MTRNTIWKRLHEWDPVGSGKLLDYHSLRGCIRSLGFWIVATYFLFNFYDFWAWFTGGERRVNEGGISWSQIWVIIIGGIGILISIVGAVGCFLICYRATKNTKGQWYDTQKITKKDLDDFFKEEQGKGKP